MLSFLKRRVQFRRVSDHYRLVAGLFETWQGPRLEVEFFPKSRLSGVSVTVGGDESDLTFGLGAWFFSLYISLRDFVPQSWRSASYARAEQRAEELSKTYWRKMYAYELDMWQGRRTGVDFHDGSAWFTFWHSDNGWSDDDHKRWPWEGNGWSWTLRVVDILFGEQKYSGELEATEPAQIQIWMPEGPYAATFRTYRCQWSRRWWKSPMYWRTEIQIPDGLPFPGKGENSWDCDDDATYGSTSAVSTEWRPAHVVALDLALETLRRRGGCEWRPAPKVPKPDGVIFKMDNVRDGVAFEDATLEDIKGNGAVIRNANHVSLMGPDGSTRVLKEVVAGTAPLAAVADA